MIWRMDTQGQVQERSLTSVTNQTSHDFRKNVIRGCWANLSLEPGKHLFILTSGVPGLKGSECGEEPGKAPRE